MHFSVMGMVIAGDRRGEHLPAGERADGTRDASPDSHLFYGVGAQWIAHSFGRVTCQPGGVNKNAEHVHYKRGFWHTPRGAVPRVPVPAPQAPALFRGEFGPPFGAPPAAHGMWKV